MVASLTYRTTDNTRWGAGQGSDLDAAPIDLNFWTLFAAVVALEANQRSLAGIDYMVVVGGNQLFVHLQDHRVIGPLILPVASWNPRGSWAPTTGYAAFDVVSNNGALYLVLLGHTSGATFSPFATDGLGHDLYALVLEEPANMLPAGGTIGQRLAKSSGSPYATEWTDDFVRVVTFVAGKPNPSELLIQFAVADFITFPAGLAGSVAYSHTPTNVSAVYNLFKNGAAIGSVTFTGPSPEHVTTTFSADVSFVPGDLFSMVAPLVPDSFQADISFSFLAKLTS